MPRLLLVVTTLAAVGSGLMSGTFFAFSTFVMKGLSRMPAEGGIRAMQAINTAVIPSTFVAVFMGTALLAFALGVVATTASCPPGARNGLMAGAILYFVGVFVVTAAFNVPRNDALALVDPTSSEGHALWARYLVEWTRWNHVRTIAGLFAAIAFGARAFVMLSGSIER